MSNTIPEGRESVVTLPTVTQSLYPIAEEIGLVLTSPVFLTFGSILGSAYFFSARTVCLILGGVIGSMVKWPQYTPRKLHHEGALIDNLMRDFLTKTGLVDSPYYNQVAHEGDRNIWLGALPIKNHKSDVEGLKKLGIKAILCAVEDVELESKTFISTPVQKQEWIQEGLAFLHIPVPDLTSIPIEQLHQAADFIKEHEEGCYIHCKAGRGRSVMCFVAYLMKHQGKTYEEAERLAKEKRPPANLKPWQIETLQDFYGSLKS